MIKQMEEQRHNQGIDLIVDFITFMIVTIILITYFIDNNEIVYSFVNNWWPWRLFQD